MEIQTAGIRDLAVLRRLENVCFEKDAWSLLELVGVLTFPDVIRLKAVEDREMVGFIAGDLRSTRGFAWISTIAVDPRYQRRGIGRALLQACEKHTINVPRMRLTVRLSNRVAVSLYEQEGYRTIDIWKEYYDDDEDALVMEKLL